jgi:hypothetical protein
LPDTARCPTGARVPGADCPGHAGGGLPSQPADNDAEPVGPPGRMHCRQERGVVTSSSLGPSEFGPARKDAPTFSVCPGRFRVLSPVASVGEAVLLCRLRIGRRAYGSAVVVRRRCGPRAAPLAPRAWAPARRCATLSPVGGAPPAQDAVVSPRLTEVARCRGPVGRTASKNCQPRGRRTTAVRSVGRGTSRFSWWRQLAERGGSRDATSLPCGISEVMTRCAWCRPRPSGGHVSGADRP